MPRLLYLAIFLSLYALCHRYCIEGSYRVVHWKTSTSWSSPIISYNNTTTSIILIFKLLTKNNINNLTIITKIQVPASSCYCVVTSVVDLPPTFQQAQFLQRVGPVGIRVGSGPGSGPTSEGEGVVRLYVGSEQGHGAVLDATGVVDQSAGTKAIWTLMSDLSDERVGVAASRVTGIESVAGSLSFAGKSMSMFKIKGAIALY